MDGQLFAGSLIVALLALAVPAVRTQDEVFPKTPYPMGRVVDEAGQPVAGAVVRIRVEHSARFARAVHQLLQRQPLVPGYSGRDGSYVLPLTERQRRLTVSEVNLSLVVEKDGYTPWVESLPRGLDGYIGSRAVLRIPVAEDRLRFSIADPIPSMLLLVERVIVGGQPYSARASRLLPVPLDGEVETILSLVPNPPQFSVHDRSLPLRLEARLLYPGRSTLPSSVPIGAKMQLSSTGAVPGGQTRTFQIEAGGTPIGLRGLYRCPDRQLRWFDLAGDMAPEDGALRLVAVVADGHLATTKIQDSTLRPVPQGGLPRRILIHDQDGKPVVGARAQLLPLEHWTSSTAQPIPETMGARPFRRFHGDDDGFLTLPATLPDEPAYLLVEAPGHLPSRLVEPRGLASTSGLQMQRRPGVSLQLDVRSTTGEPVPGASLVFGDDAYIMGALAGRPSRTDGRGSFAVDHLPEGKHSVGVIADGFETRWESITVRGSEALEVRVELTPIVPWRLVTQDSKGRPIPFAPLLKMSIAPGGRARSYVQLTTDSVGRAIVPHIGDTLTLQLKRGSRNIVLTDASRIHRVEIDPIPTVIIELEPGTSILQESWQIYGTVTSRFKTTRRNGFSRVLSRWIGGQAASVCLFVDRGSPVRVQGTEVMAGWAGDPAKIVSIDRSRTTRRVPIAVMGDGKLLREDLQVVYSPVGALNLSAGRGQVLEKTADRMELALRDNYELPCTVLHPEYQALEFTVPNRTDPDKSIELHVEKGVPLVFEVTFDRQPSPNAVMTLRVRERTAGTYILNTILEMPKLAAEDLGRPIRIVSPAAIPEGRVNIYLRVPGLPALSADAMLELGKVAAFSVKSAKK